LSMAGSYCGVGTARI
jgi:creatinine amidohydrolase